MIEILPIISQIYFNGWMASQIFHCYCLHFIFFHVNIKIDTIRFSNQIAAYVPHDRQWIKNRIYDQLKSSGSR